MRVDLPYESSLGFARLGKQESGGYKESGGGPKTHHASRRRGPARGRVLRELVGILRRPTVLPPTGV